MEDLKRKRNVIRRRVDKLKTELEELMKKNPVDQNQISARFNILQQTFQELSSLDTEVVAELNAAKATDDSIYQELEKIDEFKIAVELLRIKVNKLEEETKNEECTGSISGSEASSELKRNYRLPPIEIKKFNGKLTEWLGWWAQFEKINEDPLLTGSDKFWYLLNSIEKDTEAYETVNGYPQSNENYPKVIQVLQRQYGNQDTLLQVYIRELLSLVISNANANTKDKLSFRQLYTKVDSHLRALKTLKLEDADPATWLFPLVESSLPEEVLANWQRDSLSSHDGSKDDPPQTRLDLLLRFMEKELEIKQKIDIARRFSSETGRGATTKPATSKEVTPFKRPTVPSLASFSNTTVRKECVFCNRTNHHSSKCRELRDMTEDKIKAILFKKGLCFRCLEFHRGRECKAKLQCGNCGLPHYTVICFQARRNKRTTPDETKEGSPAKKLRPDPKTDRLISSSNEVHGSTVYMQTLMVNLESRTGSKLVRAFIDLGSQRSYVSKRAAAELNLISTGTEAVTHSLFGGVETGIEVHQKYNVRVTALTDKFTCNMEVRSKDRISRNLPRLSVTANLCEELNSHNIDITDMNPCPLRIDLMIGLDNIRKIVDPNCQLLQNGLVALKTKLGWTIVGEERELESNCSAVAVMVTYDQKLIPLWDLELLGITDPQVAYGTSSGDGVIRKEYLKLIKRNQEGRYVVPLPWKLNHPYLPDNRNISLKRLENTTTRLIQAKMFDCYQSLLDGWEKEGFIRRVSQLDRTEKLHYLPHRAVIKPESLTTPVRPVFDASCKKGRAPSLNDCLHKGHNYILEIPEIILRFQEHAVAYVSDIRKAFQMIEVEKVDQNSLRFLWWKDSSMTEVIEFCHARVPFGATSSPFILGAVLEHHLTNLKGEDKEIGQKLLQNFYVDNCVMSVPNKNEYQIFKSKAIRVMQDAKMDLRMWLSNVDEEYDEATRVISVLGIKRDRKKDVLYTDTSKIKVPDKLTKRSLLSSLHKIFDPMGYLCPLTIPVKLLLQAAWNQKLKWDVELPETDKKVAIVWHTELDSIPKIQIPRRFTSAMADKTKWSLHVFSDASKYAYAAAVFLRTEILEGVNVQLIIAKSRIAPPKTITIPRLELLGCLLGTLLLGTVKKALKIDGVAQFCWTDSTTALAWIKRNDKWGTFVGNRTEKIRKETKATDWNYVPTSMNPADLPSRGCSPKELLNFKWWQGPKWLHGKDDTWPKQSKEADEGLITAEKMKGQPIISFSVVEEVRKEHTYEQFIRIMGWILRFINNTRKKDKEETSTAVSRQLSSKELEKAELYLLKSIQIAWFTEEKLRSMKNMELLRDKEGLLRVKTRLTYREDCENFKYPILLPGKHSIVRRLITDLHRENAHCGTGILMTLLRKQFWIIKARLSIKSELNKCIKCRRFSAKPVITPTAPLPVDRVKDAEPFEVVGVDLDGPLLLKNQSKVWIVIFTCALYRAIHLELVDSLSTRAFIRSLERFILKFRRPSIIFSDNGTNFRGANNLFQSLDWNQIQHDDRISKIQWKFNPSTAAWWGGFWERLIRSVKDLLKRVIGKGTVKRGELEFLLQDIQAAINQRPLTYVTEDQNELEAITPAMFINPCGGTEFPEIEMTEARRLRFRYSYIQTLKKELQQRWRNEYLSLLVGKAKQTTREIKVGELVVVSSDNKKRMEWPLARIVDLISGRDGIKRVAVVKTEGGIITRPIQRLHPLEAESDQEGVGEIKKKATRSGRIVNLPKRYQ